MILRKLFTTVLLFSFGIVLQAQPAERHITREEYIEKYKDDAVKEMLLHGIPASITLAQGLLESNNGNSPLAKYANNHFGIKCISGWSGMTFHQDDDAKNECFRKYNSVYESFKDHSDFLSKRSRYEFLFSYSSQDYTAWANGLKQAGYATNPRYPQLLIKIIEDNELYRYDKIKKIEQIEPQLAQKKVSKLSHDVTHNVLITNNRVKYIVAKQGDSYYKIASNQEMGLWQIYKYNDLKKGDSVKEGDIVYLQPKRKKGEVDFHVVVEREDVADISQKYGVRQKSILKYNQLKEGQTLSVGQKIYLRKKPKRKG